MSQLFHWSSTFAVIYLFALAPACETEERAGEAPPTITGGAANETDVSPAGAGSGAAGGESGVVQGGVRDGGIAGASGGLGAEVGGGAGTATDGGTAGEGGFANVGSGATGGKSGVGQGGVRDGGVGGASGGGGEAVDDGGAGATTDGGVAGEDGAVDVFAGDVMPEEDAAALAAAPAQDDVPEDVQLPGGQSFADWYALNEARLTMFAGSGPSGLRLGPLASITRDAFIADYAACLEWMVQDAFWTYGEDPPDPTLGAVRPAQHGLAYVFGGKEPWTRKSSTDNVCAKQLHGVDCSGLVTLCAGFAGAHFSPSQHGSAYLLEASNWNAKLPDGLKVATIADTELPPASANAIDATGATYETGDVFVWKRRNGGIGHVGTAIRSALGLRVAQSNGASGCAPGKWTGSPMKCQQPSPQRDQLCDDNFLNPATWLNPTTGPNKKTFAFIVQHYSPSRYEARVLRVVNEVERVSVTVTGSARHAGSVELTQDGQVRSMQRVVVGDVISFGAEFETDHEITVSAKPSANSGASFTGWSGPDCGGTEAIRTFRKRLNQIECTATFDCPAPLTWNAAAGQCDGDPSCTVPLVRCPNSDTYGCPICPAGQSLVDDDYGYGCHCGCPNGAWPCDNGGCFDPSSCRCGFDAQGCGCAAETCPFFTVSQVTCDVLERSSADEGTYRVTASGIGFNVTPENSLHVPLRFFTPCQSGLCGVNGDGWLGAVSPDAWSLTLEGQFSSRGYGAEPLTVTVNGPPGGLTATCREP
jgi:hypothetical protein